MSIAVAEEPAAEVAVPPPPSRGPRRRWTRFILPGYSALVILYLMVFKPGAG